jgi:hypothetical protein
VPPLFVPPLFVPPLFAPPLGAPPVVVPPACAPPLAPTPEPLVLELVLEPLPPHEPSKTVRTNAMATDTRELIEPPILAELPIRDVALVVAPSAPC